MKKGKKLYEGKAKIIYACSEKSLVIQHFKDDATAFNNKKKSIIDGKGILNNRISEHILTYLSQVGIKNHFVKRLNMREQLIKRVEIIPIEFIVRNVATGSLTSRLGIEDGTVLDSTLVEYCLKDDKLGDPRVAEAGPRGELGQRESAWASIETAQAADSDHLQAVADLEDAGDGDQADGDCDHRLVVGQHGGERRGQHHAGGVAMGHITAST